MNYDQTKYPMIWKRTSSRGYCFTAHIPCRMIRRAGKKILIAASLVNGKERIHRVNPESLKHEPCECFGECRALEYLDRPRTVFLKNHDGRTATATVLKVSSDTATLISNGSFASYGLIPGESDWQLGSGHRVRFSTEPWNPLDAWEILPTSLNELRQMAADLEGAATK
jgi:hypothetical protein